VAAGADMLVPIHHWPAPALVVDARGRVRAANAAMARCLGIEAATLVGTALAAWALDEVELADILRNGTASPVEIRFRAADGSVRVLALSVARRATAAGDVVAAVDMTLCRAGERKLKEERDRYLDMIRAASDWLFESEITTLTESEVEARLRMIRSGADGALRHYELHTRWPGGVVDRTYDPDGLAAHMKKMTVYEPFRDMIHRQVDADGKERYFRASGVPYMRDGFYAGYRGVSANVTAQVLTEQAARRERHHLEEAQRLAGFGSAQRHLGSGAEIWSAELCRLLGIEPAAAASGVRTLASFVDKVDQARLEAVMADAAAGRPVSPATIRFVKSCGTIRPLEVVVALLRDGAGNPDSVLMVFKDAAQRR
jgi:PAS domain-containing protein